jgi:hypothetical protein
MWTARNLACKLGACLAACALTLSHAHAGAMLQTFSSARFSPHTEISARLLEDLQNLQKPNTTDAAYKDLLSLAENDKSAVSLLAVKLPSIIDKGPPDGMTNWENADDISTWENAVRLAARFKIIEACAALGKWIDVWDSQEFTSSSIFSLRIIPAAKALSQIGEPAVPTLVSILNTGNESQRWPAADALEIIHSPAAMNALTEHLARETDPHVKSLITSALRRYNAAPHPPCTERLTTFVTPEKSR